MIDSEYYLDDVVEEQGNLFQFAYYNDSKNFNDFVTRYMKSRTRSEIDRCNVKLCNYLGIQLYEWELGYKSSIDALPYITEPDWLGEFYALMQWHTCISSSELIDILPIKELRRRYGGLHDLDISLAVEKICKLKGLNFRKREMRK